MSRLGIGISPSISMSQGGAGGGGNLLAAALALWALPSYSSTTGAAIDLAPNGPGSLRVGRGLHGWYGWVKKALIGDTTSGDRGLILPGIAENYASVPSAGTTWPSTELDAQCLVVLTDWTSAAVPNPIGKYTTTGNQRSWLLRVNAAGTLALLISANGTAVTTATSSAATGVTDATPQWVRVTWRASDGRVQFFLGGTASTPSWVQLGTDQAIALATIYASTAIFEIGAIDAGTSNPVTGTIYRAIIKSSIGGTTVLDADFSTQAQGTRSFTCSTGQVVTVNQAGTSTAEPTNLWYSGTVYGWLPGTAGNYFSVPDEAALDIVGDIDIRCKVALTDWTPDAVVMLIAKDNTTNQRSYELFVMPTTGTLRLAWTSDGSTLIQIESTAAPVVADGEVLFVRATLDVDNGGNYLVRFYTSTDGTSWSQLGADVNGAGTTSIFPSTTGIVFGERAGVLSMSGKFYAAQIYSGIAGTKVLDIDFTALASYNAARTTLTAVTGQEVTINRSTTGLQTWIVEKNVALGDKVDDFVAMDDSALTDVAAGEEITLAVMGRWYGTPASTSVIAGKKSGTTAANAGYQLLIDTSKQLVAQVSDGTDLATSTSAAMADGVECIRVLRLRRAVNQVAGAVNGTWSVAGDAAAVGSLDNAVGFRLFAGAAGADFSRGGITHMALFKRSLSEEEVVHGLPSLFARL